MAYEWNRDKANRNIKKHGIYFEEAQTVFESDFNSITLSDVEHSFDEERYIEIGISHSGRLLAIVYVERETDIRIISARKATPREAKLYDQG